ncbi:E3 ubiquitin-protein ligase HUWE1-like [Pyrgilauda ruficollis]|uniref:E3 ubiquitin-protein ligase HUWE1-like n=1 Tax=Pyrgilauda ruficollis TaxID=221976 RepID=UPI001B880137|nr:E3 ubiquitin-protein ligase HUWE1-like [Pyrgilauda ruficollis]
MASLEGPSPFPRVSPTCPQHVTGISLPEGVDPSFLAALPDDIRREVLQNQLGIRPPARAPPTASPAPPVVANPGLTEVSPEFLAALPPAIQEEVLAQQRAEQQRRELAQATGSDAPMDPVTFIQTLPSELRRSVLEDMEDSVLAVMPPDIAAEAQALRREQEARQRQLMHERLFGHSSTSALSAILRSPAFTSRLSGNRGVQYTRLAVQRGGTFHMGGTGTHSRPAGSSVDSLLRLRGRLLLDHEALSCLLVLLFVDEPKLNTSRLHRVLRNLCYHAPTRGWVVRSLLSILQRSSESELCLETPRGTPGPGSEERPRGRGGGSRAGPGSAAEPRGLDLLHRMESRSSGQLSWLSVSMDAALGCRTNIFQIQRVPGRKHTEKHAAAAGSAVHIHPQAAPVVCRHVLDTLIQLAKVFPSHFTQQRGRDPTTDPERDRGPPKDQGDEDRGMGIGTGGQGGRGTWGMGTWGQRWDMVTGCHNSTGSSLGRVGVASRWHLPPTATTPTAVSLLSPAPAKSSKSPAKVPEGGSDPRLAATGLTESQLQLSVEVLTSHSCSEEGLEDAANVLLQLSRGDAGTRDTVLRLLLSGARQLGGALCRQICPCPGFDTAESVVIVASQKRALGGRELQLPSMSVLTSKTSTQRFFLRVLQVIIQLRDDTRRAHRKAKQPGRLGAAGLGAAGSIQAAVRQLEAEADAIIQMVREGQRARRRQQGDTSEAGPADAVPRREESPMDVDQPSPAPQDVGPEAAQGGDRDRDRDREERPPELPLLSEQLSLDELWDMLGECLKELEESHDQHAVLVLQPAVEAFFLVHATERESRPPVRDTRESQLAHIKDEPPPLSPAPLTPATPSALDPFFSREPSAMHISASLPPDTQKFLRFAETHRTVLNQILRQSTTHLADGPFAVLVDYIRVLDFDVKRKYFRQELERLDEGLRKEDMAVHVRRDHVFEDSYRELHRKSPEEMKNRLYIVFEGEEGQDAGGLLREWYMIISREMFNPMYALFRTSPGDRVTYTINPSSHCNPNHLSYFKFVGRIVAKAVYDNRLLECYFTRSFYKHILGKSVRYTDMESEDYHFYQGLVYLLENDVSTLGYDLTFSTEVQEFGVCEVRDLKPNGANVLVTEENKKEYVHLVCQMRMTGAIRKQLAAFLEGFYEIIPKRLISIFTEQELELLISGLPTIDIDDLKANTEYHKYQGNSIQIQWFWRALRSFDQADRAKFLQFVTGTSKVPLQGFAALEGMNGIQKFQIHRDDRSTDRLPSAHTCFNQLDLPAYESYEKLRHMLLLAIQECSEGFGLA